MTIASLKPSRIPWLPLADLLGISRSNDAFPMRVACPLCGKQQLWVYQDCVGGGQWAHCNHPTCMFSGDMIELAAAAWNVSPNAAVRRLTKLGLPLDPEETSPEALTRYVDRFPDHRRRTHGFWQQCRSNLVNSRSPELAALRARFRLVCALEPERWDRGPGQLLGAACAKEIEFFFRPYNRHPDGRVTQSHRKVFRGACWRDVLVTPSYAAPGLLCGFHFLGRKGGEHDRVFRQLERDYGKQQKLEAGLAGLDAVESSRMFPQHAIAVDSPWLAMRMQIRHHQVALQPLPLVAWHDQGRHLTRLAWRALPGRQVVFICRQLDAATIYQASQCGGHIWLLPLRHGTTGMGTILRDTAPPDLCSRAIKQARPWRDTLLAWMKHQQPDVVQKLFSELQVYPDFDAASLAEDCGLQDVSESLDIVPVREARIGSAKVVERPEGWFMAERSRRPGYLISDAIVRIDRIVLAGVRARYHGRILFAGEVIPFDVPAMELEKKPARLIIGLCLKAGAGRPRIRPRRESLVELAMAFQRPAMVKVGANSELVAS